MKTHDWNELGLKCGLDVMQGQSISFQVRSDMNVGFGRQNLRCYENG